MISAVVMNFPFMCFIVLFDDARADGHVLRPNKTPRRHTIKQRREAVADAFGDAFGGVVDS